MIFENDQVTALVISWQKTKDPTIMAQILDKSKSLIEVIVSSYDQMDRCDLIQEANARLQYACTKYNVHKGNLHNYFTTVIRNECVRYVQKQSKDYVTEDFEAYTDYYVEESDDQDNDKLHELRCRNRQRFPSLHAEDCDMFSTIIYAALMHGDSYSIIVRELAKHTSRHIALIFFNATLSYLRSENIECSKTCASKNREFTLAPDLQQIVGDELFQKVCTIFGGMNIKVPL